MRRETPENQHNCSTCYGTGTRVEVHRSRYELERVLHTYGADEVLFVEADANASIQFEMHGRYVQLALPLPDPEDSRFTHTPSGKLRKASAQERAYDQALREHWRSLIVAVRGKLQSVESGISTFEQEFDRFLVPHFASAKRRKRSTGCSADRTRSQSHSLPRSSSPPRRLVHSPCRRTSSVIWLLRSGRRSRTSRRRQVRAGTVSRSRGAAGPPRAAAQPRLTTAACSRSGRSF